MPSMLSQNKTVNYIVGGIAIASVALLAYTVTRPTKKSKKKKRKTKGRKDKSKKLSKTFSKKPIDIHLVMEDKNGFNAHIAGDKKNDKIGIKYGSRLIKINNKRVEGLAYDEIFQILQKTKAPITLYFKEMNDLCAQWTKAMSLKEEANSDYKQKKTELAIKKVSAAIELHATNKILYSNRILMCLNCEDYELALADCQIIRELDPKSLYIKGHYLRGLTLLKLKKYKNAAAAFQTVVKLNPSFKKATDRLNECLKQLETENQVAEKRRSSQQQSLKETFGANEAENVEKKEEEVAVEQVDVVKTEAKTEEIVVDDNVVKDDDVENEKVDDNVNVAKEQEEKPSNNVEEVQKENVNKEEVAVVPQDSEQIDSNATS